ncbi:MAG: hypothetical protein ABH877_02970 [bacterium]
MVEFYGWPHRPAGRQATHGWRGISMVAAGLVLAVAGIGTVHLASPAHAEDGTPNAGALIQKLIDANGGPAAYEKIQSRFSTGHVSLPQMQIELDHSSWAERPNRTYTLTESPVLGMMESGCDGSTVWENSARKGPSVKKGPERAMQLREADFDNWLNWKRYYKSATTAGADTVAGQATWKIEMVPLEGSPETMWMDQATGLLLKTSIKVQSEMGEVPVEIFFEDYREVCGLKMPFRTRQVMMKGMQEMIATIDSVACNPAVPEDRFVLPAEIRALLDKEKTEEAPVESGEG